MIAAPTGGRWRAVAGLRWHALDDEFVVFNPGSWDAHVLNESAAELLKRLEHEPASSADAAALMRALLDPACAADSAAITGTLLGELAHLGLVEHDPRA